MKKLIEELKKIENALDMIEIYLLTDPDGDNEIELLQKHWKLSQSTDDLKSEIWRTRIELEREYKTKK